MNKKHGKAIKNPIRTTIVIPADLVAQLDHIGRTFNTNKWEVFRKTLAEIPHIYAEELINNEKNKIKKLEKQILIHQERMAVLGGY